MERTMSVEEKIRRAEEIYAKKQEGKEGNTARVGIYQKNTKRDIKLLKKMIIQIIVCLANFIELYENVKNKIMEVINNKENETQNQTENEENIGGEAEQTENVNQVEQDLSQIEADIQTAKNTTSFIKPIEGTISSRYGLRNPTTSSVPKNHTGIDIAAQIGTKIKAATAGEVVLNSTEGDYGNHLKIQIGEISIIYAHCNALYVNQGDKIEQGQEIAEVGTTGNSTGPHLHFEVRVYERTIDPQTILEF